MKPDINTHVSQIDILKRMHCGPKTHLATEITHAYKIGASSLRLNVYESACTVIFQCMY